MAHLKLAVILCLMIFVVGLSVLVQADDDMAINSSPQDEDARRALKPFLLDERAAVDEQKRI
ncbi:hypothetical protein BaRGS_00002429, partial [Batillaria attramentaria]